ncbi:uncharacterized protein LOC141882083 [Acropora palmata]|uniref:uncharacterized protein LOC141882083 n=1 Tax=Acropora palmata TaxID=6131 RepID=UPI003DA1B8CA
MGIWIHTILSCMALQLQIRLLLAFVMVPLVQKELDVFRETEWNTHRIRAQKHTNLSVGISNHIHNFPDQYGLEQCGFPVAEEQEEAAFECGVLRMSDDFFPPEVRAECERIIPDFENIRPNECNDAYLYLKSKFSVSV